MVAIAMIIKEAISKMKQKILKIKIGSVFINGKSHDVFTDAWEKKSKKGDIYYEMKNPIFVQEIEKKEDSNSQQSITA